MPEDFLSFARAIPLCFLIASVQAKNGWETQSPRPQGNFLSAVAAIDSLTFVAAGGDGTILRTINGGMNWSVLKEAGGTTNNLSDISFRTHDDGWAVGSSGTIIHSTDGGLSWRQQSSGTSFHLTGVWAVNSHICFAVGSLVDYGGMVLRTTDAGETWSQFGTPDGEYLFDIAFADAGHGTAIGKFGTMYQTSDGGDSWIETNSHYKNELTGICFTSTKTGYMVGWGGAVFQTTDGGRTWPLIGVASTYYLMSIQFVTPNHGIIAANKVGINDNPTGVLFRTTDAGRSWLAIEPPTGDIQGVALSDEQHAVAVGDGGLILQSSDGGSRWQIQSTALRISWLSDVYLWSGQTGIAVGAGGRIAMTTDGWMTWHEYSMGASACYSVSFEDRVGLITGYHGELWRSFDGGESWSIIPVGTTSSLFGVKFFSPTTAVVTGDSGTILRSTDAGLNWTGVSAPARKLLYRMARSDSLTAIAVGDSGTILRTSDAGITWILIPSGTIANLRDVAILSHDTAIAVGWAGTILRSLDGGLHWDSVPSPTSSILRSVAHADGPRWVIAGFNGTILASSDGGSHWSTQTSGTHNRLYAVSMRGDTGTIVGDGGIVLSTTSGGWIDTARAPTIPVFAALSQNYPNPFNPATTIRYTLSRPAHVVVTVHNLIGQQVATLADKDVPAGTFTATFTGRELPSGVYFCRMRAGSFSDVKRMLLLK